MELTNIKILYNCSRLKIQEHFTVDIKRKDGPEQVYDVTIHNVELNNIWGDFTLTKKGADWVIDNNSNMELDTIKLITGCDILSLNKLDV